MLGNNLIKSIYSSTSGVEYADSNDLSLLISITGTTKASLADIEQLRIDNLKNTDLTRYVLLHIAIRDQNNTQGGVIAHSVFRPDGRAIEIMDYNEDRAYASVGIMNIMLGLLSDGPASDDDWSLELLNDQKQRYLQ